VAADGISGDVKQLLSHQTDRRNGVSIQGHDVSIRQGAAPDANLAPRPLKEARQVSGTQAERCRAIAGNDHAAINVALLEPAVPIDVSPFAVGYTHDVDPLTRLDGVLEVTPSPTATSAIEDVKANAILPPFRVVLAVHSKVHSCS